MAFISCSFRRTRAWTSSGLACVSSSDCGELSSRYSIARDRRRRAYTSRRVVVLTQASSRSGARNVCKCVSIRYKTCPNTSKLSSRDNFIDRQMENTMGETRVTRSRHAALSPDRHCSTRAVRSSELFPAMLSPFRLSCSRRQSSNSSPVRPPSLTAG